MLVGPSGGGKSAARDVLLEAMELMDGQKSVQYVIDPKAITKDELYGVLDPTTLEWTGMRLKQFRFFHNVTLRRYIYAHFACDY